jgi:hypothetical protein
LGNEWAKAFGWKEGRELVTRGNTQKTTINDGICPESSEGGRKKPLFVKGIFMGGNLKNFDYEKKSQTQSGMLKIPTRISTSA